MKIILLSGGSGKRLWPLSNDARSKQFLRVLVTPDGGRESMIQRVVRQIRSAGLAEDIVVATGAGQRDQVENQLPGVAIVTEPCRRDTFPAILLACSYVASQGAHADEPVIVMPCDTYTEDKYFHTVARMADAVKTGAADLVLMGVQPTYPSAKYGYVVPAEHAEEQDVLPVRRFTEKPDVATAEKLIAEGALWNGGVFAFRLGYMMEIAARVAGTESFDAIRADYGSLPKISFDYEVVEKASSTAVVPFEGQWKDLGTWNTLTDELADAIHGNVRTECCEGTYVINELEMPLVCIGAKDMVIAATPDGVLVTERCQSENLKHLVDGISLRPMYERRRWGEYKVIDDVQFEDGFCALTKQLVIKPGCSISYQRHFDRNEVWTFVDGEGELVLDGVRRVAKRGDVVNIPKGTLHALRAKTALTIIEVQQGTNLVEEDIERFPYDWEPVNERKK